MSESTALEYWIERWLTHQRALGRGYATAEWILNHLRRYLARSATVDLDQIGFEHWCASFQHLSATTRRGRQLTVRKLCTYRRRTESRCFVPDPLTFVRPVPYRRPVIVAPKQVAQMLVVADRLPPHTNSPLLPAVMRLAVILLYTAGLRRGELVRLTLADVEPQTSVLHIRASKFHKSRLVPLASDAGAALRHYLQHRVVARFPTDPAAPLLCCGSHGRHAYSGGGIREAVNRLFVAANVCDGEGRQPRVHDLRHSFAVQALIRWYQEGADVQSQLPRLAMFMGHVSIVSTAHYLHFVPTTRELASTRFEAACGDVLAEARL